jgi:hypothetical protein
MGTVGPPTSLSIHPFEVTHKPMTSNPRFVWLFPFWLVLGELRLLTTISSIDRQLTVKFHQPSHEFTFGVGMTCILSIGTNPLGITSSFVHVGFGV